MRRVLVAVCLAAYAAALASAQREPLAGFDADVAKAVADWLVPGLAIAVVKDDNLVFAHGYGVRELGKPAAVDLRSSSTSCSTRTVSRTSSSCLARAFVRKPAAAATKPRA